MNDFIHLHVHTQFSILDGASNIDKLLDKAKAHEMKALAITDHGNMFGAKIFHDKATKKGIKPILGCEVYVARNNRFAKTDKTDRSGFHLILLAKNKTGYHNLVKLISRSYTEGFYYTPRVDKELLREYHEGLIASSACLGGEVPQSIMKGNIEEARQKILEYRDIFGEDFYLELMRHKSGDPDIDSGVFRYQEEVNEVLVQFARELNIPLIATNDVHFIEADDAGAHDHLICLSTAKDIDDPDRLRYTRQEYLKSKAEMSELFHDFPEALDNTIALADKIESYKLNHDAIMPEFPIPPDFKTLDQLREECSPEDLKAEFGEAYDRMGDYEHVLKVKLEADYLRKQVYEGARWRYGEKLSDSLIERIDFELTTIKKMGFPGYFLIVQDFLDAARKMGVSVGPGRGSAAGSVVAYCTQITDVDPIKYDLLFERFLNPDRISMPDIDIDFDEDGREEILKWVVNKYGRNKVAQIVTFGTMAAKMAIRDVARVQKLPLPDADYLAKLVPDKPGTSLESAFKEVKELREAKSSENPKISETLKYAETLEGSVRQTGIHACGIIIGRDDLMEHVPVFTSKDSDLLITQYDGKYIESVGMLKMDFLGLKTLSIIKDAIENVQLSTGKLIDLSTISLEDKKTYELYAKGETTALFQFESAGMKKYLKELKPNRIDDLIAMNALYRPGPMEYIPDFVKRKHGQQTIHYDLPEMEPYLKDTYGITVYQEQVMLLSRKLAGFTGGQADSLRKAMGKKDQDMMLRLKEQFFAGCKKNNYDLKIIEKIWNDWVAFAKYAFNKSHSTCYSLLSYQTAYLKAHYPAQFMAAVLSRNITDIKKITIFLDECKRMGIKVLGPDVNESRIKFVVNKENNIRIGLVAIKGMGESVAQEIVREREEHGPYKDLYDFVERVNHQIVNRKAIANLIMAGAFDFAHPNSRHLLLADMPNSEQNFLDVLLRYGQKVQSEQNNLQTSLFGDAVEFQIPKPQPPEVEAPSKIAQLNQEKDLIGVYLSAHPLDDFRIAIDHFCTHTLADLANPEPLLNRTVAVAGIVTSAQNHLTKTGNPFLRVEMEDFHDSYRLALFGKDFLNFGKFFHDGVSVFIRGRVQRRSFGNTNEVEFRIETVEFLSEMKEKIKKLTLHIPLEAIREDVVARFMEIVEEHPGKTDVYLKIIDREDKISLDLFSRKYRIELSEHLLDYFKVEEGWDFSLS